MTHTDLATPRRGISQHRNVHAAKLPSPEAGLCALVLDIHGVITSCCDETALLFGDGPGNLLGRAIWYLVTNMTPSYTSPSFNARYIAAMSKDGRWRRFQAVDASGQRFPVELSISRVDDDDCDLFLVMLRRSTDESSVQRFMPL